MKDDFLTDHPDLDKLFEKLRLDPDSLVFAPLADGCRKAGRLEEALDICSKGVAQHPEYASGHVVLGKCYFDSQERDKAAESFNTVLSLDENNLVALKFLGMIQAENGDEAAAREHFRHILALDPENTEIRTKLEHLQADQAERDRGVTTVVPEESIDQEPVPDEEFEGKTISLGEDAETSDEFATLTLADIYASQGYTDKAIKIYREVLKARPDNIMARQKLTALELEGGRDSSPDEEMEDLSDSTEYPASGPADDRRTVKSSPDDPEDAAGRESEAKAAPAPRAPSEWGSRATKDDAKPAEKPERAIDEKSSRQHFQDWIRRMGS